MKTVKKFVYYCDHCKSKKLQKNAMVLHESVCTMNPNRTCRLCEDPVIDLAKVVESLRARYTIEVYKAATDSFFDIDTEKVKWTTEPITMDEIRNLADNCPACILAIIRQSGLFHYAIGLSFDFKAESAEYHADKMREKTDAYRHSECY